MTQTTPVCLRDCFQMHKKTMTILSALFIIFGLASSVYYVFDLKQPNHFVGDMYGLEILFRGSLFLMVLASLLIGLLMLTIGWKKKNKQLTKSGLILSNIFSVVLILMSLKVYDSRNQDENRKAYPLKSTDELTE